MAEIPSDFGVGGSGIAPRGGHGKPALVTILNDVADDLAGLQIATIASADASDLATAITLVNEIKASINVTAAYTLTTTKQP